MRAASGNPAADRDTTKLWNIYGRKYDLSSFVHNHPGGAKAILSGKGRDCWAARQIESTLNFQPNSALCSFLTISLNKQIEHHLFPCLLYTSPSPRDA